MKRTNQVVALCIIGLLMMPLTGLANMVPLSEDQLSEITGQAGFAEETTTTFNSHIDNMPILNGVLNLSDVTMQGSVVNRASTDTNISNISNLAFPGFGMMGLGLMGLGSMGFGTHLIDMTINIDKFTIGAIYVGNDKTASLGDFVMYGFQANIKGAVSITAH